MKPFLSNQNSINAPSLFWMACDRRRQDKKSMEKLFCTSHIHRHHFSFAHLYFAAAVKPAEIHKA